MESDVRASLGCYTCKRNLPLTAYYIKTTHSLRSQRCKECRQAYQQAWKRKNYERVYRHKTDEQKKNIEYRRRQKALQNMALERPADDTLKECIRCEEIKPRIEFHKKNDSVDGRQAACRICKLGDMRRRTYGLSTKEFEQMWRDQEGRCVICEDVLVPIGKAGCVVDHDHKSKKVRAILCKKCNLGIGYFRDDPTSCERAAAFLRKHSS